MSAPFGELATDADVTRILNGWPAALGKGFGCRAGASGIPGKRAGVRKPPKNEPAEKR
jgi:hypothetical protein